MSSTARREMPTTRQPKKIKKPKKAGRWPRLRKTRDWDTEILEL